MTNPFGGKNPHSLYIPMSEVEQEFVDRLCASGDLQVLIHQWGRVDNPRVSQGDHQVVIPIDLTFTAPDVPLPVTFFDLELRTQGGVTLYREKQSTVYNHQPLMVGAGTHLQMIWHIGIRAIDPNLIRQFMPGTHGLTSRAFDKDTGALTVFGNMHLDTATKRMATLVRGGEANVRRGTAREVAEAMKRAK